MRPSISRLVESRASAGRARNRDNASNCSICWINRRTLRSIKPRKCSQRAVSPRPASARTSGSVYISVLSGCRSS